MSFRDRFEELFGPVDPYDPIDVGPFGEAVPERSALPTGTDDPAPTVDDPLYTPDLNIKPRGDDSGFLENIARQFGAGVVQVGEMGVGAAEYVARQNTLLDGIVADTLYSGRRGLAGVREGILSGISKADLQKSAAEILTLDPDRTIWQGNPFEVAEAISYKFANALPATLVTFVPAARWARAASPGTAVAYMGASEGVMSTGGIANAIADEIRGMSTEQLVQESPRFAELLKANRGSADVARNELIKEAQGVSPLAGGATVAAISAVAGRYFTPIFEKPGQALGSRAARGFIAEAPQEASQGASEQLIQNFSARIYDLDRQLSEGVAEAAAQEGLIGGGMGAGFAGAFGERPAPPTPPMRTDEGGQGVLPGMEPGGTLPDELDQPSSEPPQDIQAQINDLVSGGPRTGVYIPPGQDPRTYEVPEGLVEMENVDQQGGRLIVANEEVALDARARIAQGESRQTVIGSIVGAGIGKPTGPDTRVVQLLDESGGIARESMVDNLEQAQRLADEWGPNTAILTPREAIERREVLGAGPSADIQIQEDLFDNRVARGTENVVVPEPGPDTPQQGTLPLTVGRERGVGRVPLPRATDVERPATIPAQGDEGLGPDPFEVARRQDDFFEGPSDFEPTIEDEVRQEIRSGVPFEERAEPIDVVEGSRSFGQAADRLIGRAAEKFQREEQQRIGGFYNPGRLTFDNPEYEKAYRDAWSRLVDAELTIELSQQKRAVERARSRKQKLFRELGRVRQVAKPKVSESAGAKFVRAAKAVNPAEVRELARSENRDDDSPKEYGSAVLPIREDEDFLGEFEARSREEIDALEGRELDEEFERAVRFREGRGNRIRRKKTSRGRDLVDEDQVQYRGWRDRDTPKALTGQLNITENVDDEGEFVATEPTEPELETTPATALVDYRADNQSAWKKRRFIRREAEAKRRIDTGQKKVKAPTVRVSGKTLRTEPLTVEARPLDESVSDRVKREAEAKKAAADVGKAATRANTFFRKIKSKKARDVVDEDQVADFLYARQYLEQLIQFARSIQKAKNDSKDAIRLARGVEKMLDSVQNISTEKFSTSWAKLARRNEFDMLAALDKTDLQSMREPKRRLQAIAKSNSRIRSASNLRAFNEALNNDQLASTFIQPVLRKMSDYILRAAQGRVTDPYIPNEVEIAEIRYAMMAMKMKTFPMPSKAVRERLGEIEGYNPKRGTQLYKPLRRQLEQIGFLFDDRGFITGFEASGDYLIPGYNARFGNLKPQPPSASQIDAQLNEGRRRQQSRDKEEIRDAREAARLYDKVNGLINQFKSRTASSKVTISGLKQQEQRFIRGLRKLGVWQDTSPGIGQISIVGYSSKTYRLVGPRLDAKTVLKNDARAAIQRTRTFAIPRQLSKFVTSARTPEFLAGVERFLDENATDLFMAAAKPAEYDAQYSSVAEQVGERLVGGSLTASETIDVILDTAPSGSFYHTLAEKLRFYDMSDVEVAFGSEDDFTRGQHGLFRRGDNLILVNRDALKMNRLQEDGAYGARVVHTLIHEMIHAVTHQQINTLPRFRQYLESLQLRAREVWEDRVGRSLPYGLKVLPKAENQAHEFIAEAFSNHEFQNFLKDTPIKPNGRRSLWKGLVRAVRYLLDLPAEAPSSIFDAIMLTEDVLFDDVGVGAGPTGNLAMMGDGVIDNITSLVGDQYSKSMGWFSRVKNAARNLMTFEQLRDTYTKYFEGMEGGNGLARYMDAWARRNASVSKYMKEPEGLSTRWTKMEATDPETALEISRLGTESTIYRITPGKKLSAKKRTEIDENRLKKYDELRARYKNMPTEAQNLYDDIAKWYKASAADESKLLLAASLRGVLTKGRGASMTAQEFQDKFTDDVVASMEDQESISAQLRDIVPEDEIEGLVKELTRMASLRTTGSGDYFPLMRYGDYVVYAETKRPVEKAADRKDAYARRKELLLKDPTLDVGVVEAKDGWEVRVVEKAFFMHESKSEADKTRMAIQGDYDFVSPVQAKIAHDTEEVAIRSNAALDSILRSLSGNPAAAAAIKNHYLRSLSDKSFRKRELKRQNRRGVDYDVQHRNLANYLKQSAYYRSQLKYGWKMGEALRDLVEFTRKRPDSPEMSTEQLQQVVKNIQYRDQMTHDPTELNKLVRSGVNLTQFMMLTSPSYWMINASQPWLVTAPIMGGRHGVGASYAALKDALQMVKTPLTQEALQSWGGLKVLKDKAAANQAFNVVDQLFDHLRANGREDYIELIGELRDQNIIDINVLTELREIAEGVEGNLTTRVLDASRILAHITEVNNRVVTAIAAYNLELGRTGNKTAAKKYAADMISQTQFNYSTQNKPPLFQAEGPLKWAAPLMFQFMQWPQHMYALLIRNVRASVKGASAEERAMARKSLIGLLSTHAAVGGAVGMALQPIKWALGMIMFAFGDDDEPYTLANAINGRTFDHMVTETVTELFGDKIGGAAARGLPTLIGTDLSNRMSMGTLYFVDLRGDNVEAIAGSLVASFGGATLNQALNWGDALNKIASGDVYRGVEQGMPKIVRDVMRAGRYYNDGLVNNNGDTVIPARDLSFGESFLQGIGFQPDEVSRFYQGQAAIKGAQGYARDWRERLIRRFVEGGAGNDVLREVLEFNRAYPSLRITRSTLIRSARGQLEREKRYRRYGANIDDQETRGFAEYGEPYR